MANTPTVYVICDQNCKFEGMTKEQIYAAIVQAVNEGTIGNIDTGFVQTIKTINGTALKFFVGTQAEYKTLADEEKENLFAIITDDTAQANISIAIRELQTEIEETKNKLENYANTTTNKAISANLLNTALALPTGVYNYQLSSYADNDIPYVVLTNDNDNAYAHSIATIYKTGANYITVVLWGGEVAPIQYCRYFKGTWTSWEKLATQDGIVARAEYAATAAEATRASVLNYDGTEFGRRLLHTYSAYSGSVLTSTYVSHVTNYNLENKFLVVELEVQTGTIYDGAVYGKFRTPPFCFKKYTYSTVTFNEPFTFECNGATISFIVEGSTLYAKIDGNNTEYDKYCITKIYEEF